MSKLRDRRGRHDHYYRRAKQQRFAARSVFKLEEINRRFRIFRRGQRVLDLGCRPGSWMQFAADRVGETGRIIGIDREAVEIALPSQVTTLVGDVLEMDLQLLREQADGCYHVVLSDMAPDTTGVAFTDQVRSIELCSHALDLSIALGCPGGSFVGKVFMGDGFSDLVSQAKAQYTKTKTVRPDATRKSSTEVYLVATDRKRQPPKTAKA